MSLTHLVVGKLPRAAGHTTLAKKWKESEVEKQWKESAWAKKREQKARRSELTDFERFKAMKLRKQVSNTWLLAFVWNFGAATDRNTGSFRGPQGTGNCQEGCGIDNYGVGAGVLVRHYGFITSVFNRTVRRRRFICLDE